MFTLWRCWNVLKGFVKQKNVQNTTGARHGWKKVKQKASEILSKIFFIVHFKPGIKEWVDSVMSIFMTISPGNFYASLCCFDSCQMQKSYSNFMNDFFRVYCIVNWEYCEWSSVGSWMWGLSFKYIGSGILLPFAKLQFLIQFKLSFYHNKSRMHSDWLKLLKHSKSNDKLSFEL